MIFYLIKRRVIVNTKTGKAFRGILWRQGFGYVIMKNAELLEAGGKAVMVDGEVVIYKTDIEFIQVLP